MSPLWHAVAHAGLVALMGLLATTGGAWLVRTMFRLVDRRAAATPADSPAAAAQVRKSVIAAGAHLRGGVWIGLLERLSIYSALVAHYPEAIAVVLAVKGLARYPELQATDTAAAERFIIGTFVSVLFACAMGGLTLWLAGLLP